MARNFAAEKQKIIDDLLAKGVSTYEAEMISDQQIEQMKLGPTAFEQISADETLRSAQNDSMGRYQEMADNGGYTAADRAALNQNSQRVAQQDNARRLAILSEMQQRGKAGGGAELAARLAGADSAATQQANDSQEIAARGEARRDGAIAARGQLAGQVREQDYRQESNLANARDGVSRFNADLTGRATMQNNNTTNEANRYNTGSQNQFDQNAGQLRYNSVVEAEQIQAAKDAEKKKKKSGIGAAIGGIAGAAIGTYVAPGVGTAAGASLGSSIGGSFAHGGKIEGPEVKKGDGHENDVIPITVSAGEIVIPKSKTTPVEAAEFVAEVNGDEPSLEETVLVIAKALAKLKGR